MSQAQRARVSSLTLLLAGAFFGMSFILSCGGGGAGGPPASAAGGVFAAALHVDPDASGPHALSYRAGADPVGVIDEVRSVVFTPQGPHDVLLAVMAEGAYSTAIPGITLTVEVYMENAGGSVARQAVDLSPQGSAFLVSLPFHGASFSPGGTLPAGSIAIRAFAEVQEENPGQTQVTIQNLDFKIVCLEDVQVVDPTTRTTPNPLDADADGDGWTPRMGDCDDTRETVHPGAPELADGIDNDCDGEIDEGAPSQPTWWRDADGDGWGTLSDSVQADTKPVGYVGRFGDCDDNDASISPDAEEVVGDGVDNNCNGYIDETESILFLDADGDGYGDSSHPLFGHPGWPEHVKYGGDCNDSDSHTYPGAPEYKDGEDTNCDGVSD